MAKTRRSATGPALGGPSMIRRLGVAGVVAASLVGAALSAQAGSPHLTQTSFGAPPGGFAAYHGLRLAKDPAGPTAPQNTPVAYSGPKLVLAQSYVGRKAAEPTVGVDGKGDIYTVAADFDAVPGSPPKNEPRTLVERSTDGGRTWHVTQPAIAGQ